LDNRHLQSQRFWLPSPAETKKKVKMGRIWMVGGLGAVRKKRRREGLMAKCWRPAGGGRRPSRERRRTGSGGTERGGRGRPIPILTSGGDGSGREIDGRRRWRAREGDRGMGTFVARSSRGGGALDCVEGGGRGGRTGGGPQWDRVGLTRRARGGKRGRPSGKRQTHNFSPLRTF
jgi:hypothetical protein